MKKKKANLVIGVYAQHLNPYYNVVENTSTNHLKLVKKITKLPIIFAGGVGKFDDFIIGIENNLNAIAAGNIFHYTENSYYQAIKFLYENNCNMRPPILNKF